MGYAELAMDVSVDGTRQRRVDALALQCGEELARLVGLVALGRDQLGQQPSPHDVGVGRTLSVSARAFEMRALGRMFRGNAPRQQQPQQCREDEQRADHGLDRITCAT